MSKSTNDKISLKQFFGYLDQLSEMNKIGGKGHGDLEDNCPICGISPSGHKKFIAKLIKETLQECIGEKEIALDPFGMDFEDGKKEYAKEIRNQLRQQALTKLEELLNG